MRALGDVLQGSAAGLSADRWHRTFLLAATMATVVATLPFVAPVPLWSVPVLAWSSLMGLLTAASASGRLERPLRTLGAPATVLLVLWMVWMTGGSTSPYNALYVPIAGYVAAFHGTPRFATALLLALLASVAPGAAAGDTGMLSTDLIAGFAIALTLVVVHVVAVRQRDAGELYLSVIERHSGPAYVLAPDGAVRWINQAAADVLRLPVAEVAGRKWPELVAPEERERLLPVFLGALEGVPQTTTFLTDTAAGSARLRTTLLPIFRGGRVTGMVGLTEDITELHAAAFDARALARTLDRSSLPVAIYDAADHAVLYGNVASWALTPSGVPDPERAAPAWDELRPELREAVPSSGENRTVSVTVDGRSALDVTIDWLDVGRPIVTYTAIDVTDRVQRESSLRRLAEAEHEAADRLRNLSRIRDAFLTAISHDLRTPLTVVIGAAKTLRRLRDEGDRETRDRLEDALVRQAEQLGERIRDLLDVDRLARGRLVADRSTFDLVPLARRLLDHAAVPERCRLESPPQLPVEADEQQVERILTNLLDNAAKYAPEASVTVRLEQRGDDGFRIEVADDGPGIPPEELQRIFEPFHRVDLDDPQPGSGVGLALVAEFASIHGGKAWAELGPTGGMVAIVEVPGP